MFFLFEQIYVNNLADLPRSKLGKADFFFPLLFFSSLCLSHISDVGDTYSIFGTLSLICTKLIHLANSGFNHFFSK